MTDEDITRMAREAGWKDLPTVRLAFAGFDLSYFASLVYEATFRDANIAASKTILDAAVLEEREACAKVCVAENLIDYPTKFEVAAINKCASAIRARGRE